MKFFTNEQKKVALIHSPEDLKRLYKLSEKRLKESAKRDDDFGLERAMEKHQLFEYASLYQKTSEYKQKKNELSKAKENGTFDCNNCYSYFYKGIKK